MSFSDLRSMLLLLLGRYCIFARPSPPRTCLFTLSTTIMPPRKRAAVAPSASASSGSDYEASPAPKGGKKAKAAAASKKSAAASKKEKKSPVADGPKGLAPGWIKYGDYVIAK